MAILTTLGLFGFLLLLSSLTGIPRERVLTGGFGTYVLVLTVLRPAWYWENPKAKAMRQALGDEAAAGFYVILALVLMYLGTFTDCRFLKPAPRQGALPPAVVVARW